MNRQEAVKYLTSLAEHFDNQDLGFIGDYIMQSLEALNVTERDPMPCRECGGRAFVKPCYWHAEYRTTYAVKCERCRSVLRRGAGKNRHEGMIDFDTAEDAVMAWNAAMRGEAANG